VLNSTDIPVVYCINSDLNAKNQGIFITPYVSDMLKDLKWNYWFGSQSGLIEFSSPVKHALYDIHNSGLASNFVSSINEDYSGNLWILTSTGGINIFNEKGICDEQKIIRFFTQKEAANPE